MFGASPGAAGKASLIMEEELAQLPWCRQPTVTLPQPEGPGESKRYTSGPHGVEGGSPKGMAVRGRSGSAWGTGVGLAVRFPSEEASAGGQTERGGG